MQSQQVFLVFCFEREIVREQLGIVRKIVRKSQEFLNNYIIHLNHILYSVLNITGNYKYYLSIGWERLFP